MFGRGRNRGQGRGMDAGAGVSRGRMGGQAAGLGGNCICVNPNCRYELVHQRGIPCYQLKCPKCGSPMTRK